MAQTMAELQELNKSLLLTVCSVPLQKKSTKTNRARKTKPKKTKKKKKSLRQFPLRSLIKYQATLFPQVVLTLFHQTFQIIYLLWQPLPISMLLGSLRFPRLHRTLLARPFPAQAGINQPRTIPNILFQVSRPRFPKTTLQIPSLLCPHWARLTDV